MGKLAVVVLVRTATYQPPVAEGAVWGCGSIDDKGSLIGLFEAIEALALKPTAPTRT